MKIDRISSKSFSPASFRIDPSFHLSEGVKVREKLEKAPFRLLTVNDVAEDVFIGNIFSRVFVYNPKFGTPYLQASDSVLADLDTGRYLSNKQVNMLSYLVLRKDWILATCSGTLGNVSYTNKIYDGRIATHDLIRIVPNDKILRGCVYAFLSSKYGYYQFTQSKFGGVVKHINADYAKSIIIPEFDSSLQQRVDSMIKESASLREDAYVLISEARKSIVSLINCPVIPKSNTTSIKKIRESYTTRLEGAYYISENRQYYDFLSTSGIKVSMLKDLTTKIFKPNIFKRSYVEKGGVELLGGADIMDAIPSSPKRISQMQFEQMPELQLDRNMILITRAGTIGKTMIADNQLSKKAVSEDVLRIVPNDKILPGYLYAFLTSSIGAKLITLYTYGSVIQHIESGHVERIPVPLFSDDDMKRINNLAEESMSKIEKAKELELLAISIIEEEVSKWS